MAAKEKLERVLSGIQPQTEVEQRVLRLMTRRLEINLSTLRKITGDTAVDQCFRAMMDAALSQGTTDCLDQYEECVERLLTATLRRPLTEREELAIGQLMDEILGETEMLLALAGVELADVEGEEPEETDRA